MQATLGVSRLRDWFYVERDVNVDGVGVGISAGDMPGRCGAKRSQIEGSPATFVPIVQWILRVRRATLRLMVLTTEAVLQPMSCLW